MKRILILTLITSLLACLPAAAQELDLRDNTSAAITGKAWEALSAKNYPTAVAYAKKCVEMYEPQAIAMQKELKEPATGERETISKLWALNDVGTCLFISGQALEKQQKTAEAVAAYQELVAKLPFSQCWDPKGWFWKPAEGAKGRIKALEFDALK